MTQTVELGSLFTHIRNGMNVKQDKELGGLPITRIETISNWTVDGDRVGYSGLEEAESSRWLLEPEDILFSHINSPDHIGKCALYEGYPKKLVHGMNLLCFRPDTRRLHPLYMVYFFRTNAFRRKLEPFINKAVNQANVSIGNIKTIQISVPSIAEQLRIAEILSQADGLCQKRRKTLECFSSLLEAVFAKICDSSTPVITIGSALDQRILLIHKDGNHGSLYPRAEDFGRESIPFVTAKSISGDGYLEDRFTERLSETKAATLKHGWINTSDVLLAHNATVGRVGLYRGEYARAIVGTSLTVFRPNPERVLPEFLYAALRAQGFQSQLTKNMGQATRNQVPITAQRSLTVPIPDIEVQHLFSRKLAEVDSLREHARRHFDKLNALFASLQHRAFNGELTSKHAERELEMVG
jgi:type I restriction enzyme S subunit